MSIPNDVRGQTFRILLDPKCVAPFCLSPNRGYVSGLHGLCPRAWRWKPRRFIGRMLMLRPLPIRLERSSSGGTVEQRSHSLVLNPTPFARTFVGAIPRRTSALAVGPSVQAVGLNRTRKCGLQNLSLHRGPRLRGAAGMEPDPFALLPRFIHYSGDAPRPVHSTCRACSAEPDGCAEQGL